MPVVDCLVRPIVLDTLGPLNATNTCCVTPLPTVLALWNTWVHVSIMYDSNETPNVELSIDNSFGLRTILGVPCINPDNIPI